MTDDIMLERNIAIMLERAYRPARMDPAYRNELLKLLTSELRENPAVRLAIRRKRTLMASSLAAAALLIGLGIWIGVQSSDFGRDLTIETGGTMPADRGTEPPKAPVGMIAYVVRPAATTDSPWRRYEIWTIDPDGGNSRRLTQNDCYDGSPTWSPDGTRITFASDRDATPPARTNLIDLDGFTLKSLVNTEIYSMDARGGDVRRLTNNATCDDAPSLSPDGRRIAFRSCVAGRSLINIMALGGPVTPVAEIGRYAWAPTWSHDGKGIYYLDIDNGKTGLYRVDADGRDARLLIDIGGLTGNAYLMSPSCSPDGKKIAFVAGVNDVANVYVMNADGSGARSLTDKGAKHLFPAWSPDGRSIAFVSNRGGNFDLYVMDTDGRNVRQLTLTPDDECYPAWQPHGIARPR